MDTPMTNTIAGDNLPPVPEFRTVGVIGAGQMGSGIVHVCALAGYDVRLSDLSEEQLDKALANIDRNMERQVNGGKISREDKDAGLARIKTGTSYDLFADCDIVIECAVENEEVKRGILKDLCGSIRPDTVIATNTSSISITRLAAVTDRPGRFIGMHFMNPVPVMELIELIRGIATDEDTFAAVREMALRLGKTPASAEDFPAFIVNRILLPMRSTKLLPCIPLSCPQRGHA